MYKIEKITSSIGKQFKKVDSGILVTVVSYDVNTDGVRLQRRDGGCFMTTGDDFLDNYMESSLFVNKVNDPVNHPSHYTKGKIEVIDFIEDQKLNYHLSSVIKYVCRSPHKGNQIEDLQKARWYLEREISNLQNQVVPDWDRAISPLNKAIEREIDS